MGSSIITIPTDSRFINALVFLLFDVLVLNLLVIFLNVSHSSSIKRRMIRGHRVRLSQNRLSPFLGGILDDATPLTYIFIALHFTIIILLFLLTVGINGRSDTVTVSASRQYLTRIAANGNADFGRSRLRPSMFATCLTESNSSIRYYPTAFDIKGSAPLEDLFDFRDSEGNRVDIDVDGMLCQSTGNLPPMLAVRRCGDSMDSCGNLEIGPDYRVELRPAIDSSRRTEATSVTPVGQQTSAATVEQQTSAMPELLSVMYRRVRFISPEMGSVQYNRLICREWPTQGEERPLVDIYFNCVVGQWDEDEFFFTFRFAQMRFERTAEKRQSVMLDWSSEGIDVRVTTMSAEMVVEWDAKENGEVFFADTLAAVGPDAVTGRAYLDAAVRRLVVADTISDRVEVARSEERLVTDIHIVALVGYGIMGLMTVVLWLILKVYGKRLKRHGDLVDVTSFRGVAGLLRRDILKSEETKQKWIEFGVTQHVEDDSILYRVTPLHANEVVVPLPSGEVLK